MKRMKRAWRGLYGNRMIQFGNKVSFAGNKTRRTWKPNVQMTTVKSETLQERFRWRVTTYVMRCIRKAGGLDEYLLRASDAEIKFPVALDVKRRIIELRAKAADEAKAAADGVQVKLSDGGAQKEMAAAEHANMAGDTAVDEAVAEQPVGQQTSAAPLHGTASVKSYTRGLLDLL